jgi:hypothetical protein
MTRVSIALVAAALVAHAVVVDAAPLDKEECAKLKGEQAQLEQEDVRTNMGRGPEWAKANLAPEKLELVRRIIEIDEQLLFRCQGKPLVSFREAADPDPAAAGSKEATKAPVAKAVKTPVKKAAVQPATGVVKEAPKVRPPVKKPAAAPAPAKPGPAKAAPAGTTGDAAPKADAPKEAKPKPKRKGNVADSSSDWITNPFADLLAPANK